MSAKLYDKSEFVGINLCQMCIYVYIYTYIIYIYIYIYCIQVYNVCDVRVVRGCV